MFHKYLNPYSVESLYNYSFLNCKELDLVKIKCTVKFPLFSQYFSNYVIENKIRNRPLNVLSTNKFVSEATYSVKNPNIHILVFYQKSCIHTQ